METGAFAFAVGAVVEVSLLFTWLGLGLIEDPEFEAAIPGATTTPDEAWLIRNDLRVACLGDVFRLLGKATEDDAMEVRGDWAGV